MQWVAIGRRSAGAWSAWCRVGAALHLAVSSVEKVFAVRSAYHYKGRPHARIFSIHCTMPWSLKEGLVLCIWGGGAIGLLHPHWILSVLLLCVPSHFNATQVECLGTYLEYTWPLEDVHTNFGAIKFQLHSHVLTGGKLCLYSIFLPV